MQTSDLLQAAAEKGATLHSIFILFPTILFTAGLICDLLNSFGKQKALIVGHWFIILGVLSCIPAITTGLQSALDLPPTEILLKHRWLGMATGISGSIYAGLRISVMYWKLSIPPNIYLGLSILLVALASWTSDTGLLITRLPN